MLKTQQIPPSPINSHHPGHTVKAKAPVSTQLAESLSSKPFTGHDLYPHPHG